ncbi:H(+)/Cl(-) Exchange Transporter 4 [Manis pentadactyla]|nr:H(+)/Cl(-) Exchange Transporter 4 [Manis pentadactyla]
MSLSPSTYTSVWCRRRNTTRVEEKEGKDRTKEETGVFLITKSGRETPGIRCGEKGYQADESSTSVACCGFC